MPKLSTNKVTITGICCALPNNPKSVFEIGRNHFEEEVISKTTSAVGAETIYVAAEDQTASDLCYEAATHLIDKLTWEKDSIDGLLFISHTPDYIMPSTSTVLQHRLGLSTNCIAFDISLACSGFVNGLFLASQLIETKTCKRILVLVGDTLRRNISPKDRGVTFIISDAGSATALEYTDSGETSTFISYVDGSGYQELIIKAGGYRLPKNEKTALMAEDEDGNKRSEENFYMNGMNVFTFAIKKVPAVILEIMKEHGWEEKDVDKVLLHQANAYMIKYIYKRAKIPAEKVPININKFGNTNGTTIPLLICDLYKDKLNAGDHVIMSGFGVGLSWGAAAMTLGELNCSDIIFI